MRRQAGAVVGLDIDRAQGPFAHGRGQPLGRHLAGKTPNRGFLDHADDGIVVAAHAYVGHVAGTVREDVGVGRRNMGMGADRHRHSSVHHMAQRHLFRRGLAMDIQQDRRDAAAQAVFRQHLFDGSEGTVERIHEQPRHHVEDHDLLPAAAGEDVLAAPRCAFRVIARPQEPRVAVDMGQDLAVVPAVVAAGDDIDARGVELFADLAGDAEAAGRVLAVDDDEIGIQLLAQRRQVREHGVAPRSSDDVAAKQNLHELVRPPAAGWSPTRRAPVSVISQSSGTSAGSCGTLSTSCPAKARPMATAGPARRRLAIERS